MSAPQGDEKVIATVEHVDNKVDRVDKADSGSMMKEVGAEDNLDRFGAWKKTDPAEIALVRKLDWHIMVNMNLRTIY
tara:strand:+ start:531 stop:761 length:231 start_codon:yes stop_codon:yes gene_type:complete